MIIGKKQVGGQALADAVLELYAEGQQDYYLDPLVLVDPTGSPVGRIKDGDGVIFCCRRGEREIQLTEAFTDPTFSHFPRPALDQLTFVILTLYHEKFAHLPVAFAPSKVEETLGEIVSKARMSQLRVAESEKFAHITFFLNGGRSQPYEGEVDVRIPSRKGVAFDQVPEMSLAEVAERTAVGVKQHYDLIAVNFANGDVIGHTANDAAKISCAEVVDEHLGIVVRAAMAENYVVLITADHGNLEIMRKSDGSPHVSHTENLVPFILIDPESPDKPELRDGKLADIAPTILSVLGLQPPPSMEGASLAGEYDCGENRRVLLLILDGWGIGEMDNHNPIYVAHTPFWDGYISQQAQCKLRASGEAVGLKEGKAGNSEAGHMNIGAGRVVLQDDQRLDKAMQDGAFYHNAVFCQVLEDVKARGTDLHLLALLTEKSSHGSIDYPLALLQMAKEHGFSKAYVHVIFDGRSTEPGSAPDLLSSFQQKIDEIGIGEIVSGVGRGIALDRDGNYDKTQRAFDALTLGVGRQCKIG
jgi:2,3-bisphosphoglycerate-independent phosphoglycerate mutase